MIRRPAAARRETSHCAAIYRPHLLNQLVSPCRLVCRDLRPPPWRRVSRRPLWSRRARSRPERPCTAFLYHVGPWSNYPRCRSCVASCAFVGAHCSPGERYGRARPDLRHLSVPVRHRDAARRHVARGAPPFPDPPAASRLPFFSERGFRRALSQSEWHQPAEPTAARRRSR